MQDLRALWRWYLLALSAVGLLTVAGSALIQRMVATQEGAAAVIDRAGRQRMLSQRVAILVRQWADAPAEAKPLAAAHVSEVVDALEQAQRWLDGSEGGATGPERGQASSQAHRSLDPYLVNIRAALAGDVSAMGRALGMAPADVLSAFEAQVAVHSHAASQRINRIIGFERLLVVLVLLLLVVEATLLFRPLHRRLARSLESLREQDRLQKQLLAAGGDGWALLRPDGALAEPPSPRLALWFPAMEKEGFFESLFLPEEARQAKTAFRSEPAALPQRCHDGPRSFELRSQQVLGSELLLVVVRDVSAHRALAIATLQRDLAQLQAAQSASSQVASAGPVVASLAEALLQPLESVRRHAVRLEVESAEAREIQDQAEQLAHFAGELRLLGGGQGPAGVNLSHEVDAFAGELLDANVTLGATPVIRATPDEVQTVTRRFVQCAVGASSVRTFTDERGWGVAEVEFGGELAPALQAQGALPLSSLRPELHDRLSLAVAQTVVVLRGGEFSARSMQGHGTLLRAAWPPMI